MKNKTLAVQSILEMTENQAHECQVSGHSPFSQAWMHWKLMASRPCLLFLFLLGIPVAITAQTEKGSWSDLSGLKVGQGIDVIESSMKSHGGTFV